MIRGVVLQSLMVAALLAACQDPVHSAEVAALGPEANGVPAGATHRPGQPCLVCHGDAGPASMVFSIAGTVDQPNQQQNALGTGPAANVLIHFRDAHKHEFTTGTNCAGNFYVQPGEFSPEWPVAIWLEYAGITSTMTSVAFREGSCAKCHRQGAPTYDSPGPVYFRPDQPATVLPPGGCR